MGIVASSPQASSLPLHRGVLGATHVASDEAALFEELLGGFLILVVHHDELVPLWNIAERVEEQASILLPAWLEVDFGLTA